MHQGWIKSWIHGSKLLSLEYCVVVAFSLYAFIIGRDGRCIVWSRGRWNEGETRRAKPPLKGSPVNTPRLTPDQKGAPEFHKRIL